jgi:hypothetical protein
MDTMRFLRAHWSLLQKNPFDVYYYIRFTPLLSIFRQVYTQSSPLPYSVTSIDPEPHWPSESVVQAHNIEAQSLSLCGNWFATGGYSNNRPIFAVWDIQTADGTTTTHPCPGAKCSIYYIGFHQRKDIIELKTRCKCERLCIWDITTDPITLLQEVQLKSSRALKCWADDGSKAISEGDAQGFRLYCYLSTLIDGKEVDKFRFECDSSDYKWIFSPGTGQKIVHWSKHALEVLECSSGRRCFKKFMILDGCSDFGPICFSPDAASIFYSRKGNRYAPGRWATGLLSSEDGTQLWYQSMDEAFHVDFFPGGDRLLVRTDKSISVLSSFDGSVRQSSSLTPLNMSISPAHNEIAALTGEGIEILESVTLERIRWYPWNNLTNIMFVNISWKHSTIVKVNCLGPVDQSITFFKLLSSETSPKDASLETKAAVANLFLSPDALHLLIRHQDGSIQLWHTTSGNKIALTGDYTDKLGSDFQVEFTEDSSVIIIVRREFKNRPVTVDTKTGRVKAIHLPSSQIMAVTLCPFSSTSFSSIKIIRSLSFPSMVRARICWAESRALSQVLRG